MYQLSLFEAAEGIREKKFTPSELTQETLARIEQLNPQINAFVSVQKDSAMAAAKEADGRAEKGELKSMIDGIPGALKDIFNTKDVASTCCSRMLKDFVPPYDSSVVARLRDGGMILTGKLNMDEFACGASTEHSYFGVTKNPWDLERVAGGSSGGSAAAIAADMCFYTLGTDTGGSIRQPASLCSVVGMKVTYGRVSRSGVTAMASSWDTVGPMTKTVRDAAIVLQMIAGKDPLDATTPDIAVPNYLENLGKPIAGMKIGVPKEYFGEGIDPEVAQTVRNALAEYEKMGAIIKEVSLPYTKYAVAVYYITMPAELSANLSRYDGIRFGLKPEGEVKELIDQFYLTRDQGFGDEIKRRILIGTYVLSAGYYDSYYRKAQKVRTLILQDFENVFKEVDVLVAPVSPFPAFKIGEKANDPLAMYLADIFTIPVSAAGVPALSVPCGFTQSGLPVGMQVIGPHFSESLLFQVGAAYEQVTDWGKRRPQL